MEKENKQKLLIIEPFYGGSHKRLIDTICTNLAEDEYFLVTMKAKKWHWRARTSALYISTQIPTNHTFEVMFCTSVLPLTELLGLRPDLVKLRKIAYFHENQLAFPVQVIKKRDFQYGFNEILTCIAADKVLFNSRYNQESFLSHINQHMKMQPDYRIKDLDETIRAKCFVIFYPLDLNSIDSYLLKVTVDRHNCLHIVWPHRWEFDKNPDVFIRVLCKLSDNGHDFKVSILGESFQEKPEAFKEISRKLKSNLLHCGYLDSPILYYRVLKNSDVVISTAIHEFFGVSVLEAVYCGCIPVVPNRLAYKELYGHSVEEMYNDEEELYNVLAMLCNYKRKGILNKDYRHLASPYDSKKWFNRLIQVLNVNVSCVISC